MSGELYWGGVFIPPLLLIGAAALAVSFLFRRVLRAAHAYRFVWHAGLFDVALYVVLVWLITMLTAGAAP